MLAYVATLIIGGAGVYLLSRVLGDDGSASAPTPVTGEDGLVDGADGQPPGAIPDPAAGAAGAAAGAASASAELTIPLAPSDVSFGEGATTSESSPGPGADTLCANAPETAGLVEWKGQVITGQPGPPTLYQVVSRFETADQASRYLDAYAGTNDCESWLVAAAEPSAVDVVYAALQTTPPSYGDQSRQFEITGEVDDEASIHAKVLLIQSGTDVLSISLTTQSPEQLDELDQLATVAAERLGYATS